MTLSSTILSMFLLQTPVQEYHLDMNGDKIKDTITTTTRPSYTINVHDPSKEPFTVKITITDGKTKEEKTFSLESDEQLYMTILEGIKQHYPTPRPMLQPYPSILVTNKTNRTEVIEYNGKNYEHSIVTYTQKRSLK